MYYMCFEKRLSPVFSSAGKFLSGGGVVHPRRNLDTAVLLLGCEGEYAISQDGREYTLSKGCFQLLFPGVTHYGTRQTSGAQSHFWCHFHVPKEYFIVSDDGLSEFAGDDYFILPEFLSASDFEKYFVIFNQMIDEAEAWADNAEICSCYIRILLCHLDLLNRSSADSKSPTAKRAAVSRIKEFLRLEACTGISASEASERLGYNPDHLNRIIKSETGMTLTSYLNFVRISRAKSLLLEGSMKVCDIAVACGFSDEKYFMKLFKRLESVTPSEYRDAHFRVHTNR